MDTAFRFFEGMGLVEARRGAWVDASRERESFSADFVLHTKKVEVILKPVSDTKKHVHEEHQKEIFITRRHIEGWRFESRRFFRFE